MRAVIDKLTVEFTQLDNVLVHRWRIDAALVDRYAIAMRCDIRP
jgi:hypothetical protein